MSDNYRLYIRTSQKLTDPEYTKDLIDVGISPFVAKGSVAVAYCFGECVLARGTLDEMEQLQKAIAAKGRDSRVVFRDKPHDEGTSDLGEDSDSDSTLS